MTTTTERTATLCGALAALPVATSYSSAYSPSGDAAFARRSSSWSGIIARASQSRQNLVVASSCSEASSAVVGMRACSLQASAH